MLMKKCRNEEEEESEEEVKEKQKEKKKKFQRKSKKPIRFDENFFGGGKFMKISGKRPSFCVFEM